MDFKSLGIGYFIFGIDTSFLIYRLLLLRERSDSVVFVTRLPTWRDEIIDPVYDFRTFYHFPVAHGDSKFRVRQ